MLTRARTAAPRRRNKYGAKRTADGFASQVERDYYLHLMLLEKAGEIADVYTHPAFQVEPDGCASIRYTADFVYRERGGQLVCVDVKGGAILPDASKAMRLFCWRYPTYELRIVRRERGQWIAQRFGERRKKVQR